MTTPYKITLTKEEYKKFTELAIKASVGKMRSSPEWKKIAELRAQNDHATIKTDEKENET